MSTQPTGQTCTVSSGSGTVTGTVTSVSVSCTTNTYSIGGTITGLTASGLVLTDNGGNPLSVSSGSTSFTFSTQLAYGATYAVAVSTQPTRTACTVSNGSGTVTGTVTSVSLSCVNSYTIGGTISGLTIEQRRAGQRQRHRDGLGGLELLGVSRAPLPPAAATR